MLKHHTQSIQEADGVATCKLCPIAVQVLALLLWEMPT